MLIALWSFTLSYSHLYFTKWDLTKAVVGNSCHTSIILRCCASATSATNSPYTFKCNLCSRDERNIFAVNHHQESSGTKQGSNTRMYNELDVVPLGDQTWLIIEATPWHHLDEIVLWFLSPSPSQGVQQISFSRTFHVAMQIINRNQAGHWTKSDLISRGQPQVTPPDLFNWARGRGRVTPPEWWLKPIFYFISWCLNHH